MKRYVPLFAILLLLVACHNEQQVIVKKESSPDKSHIEPTLVEQPEKDDDENEVDELIEFILPEEKVMINLEMVPILNAYLSASSDREKTVEQMNLQPIEYENSHLYLLEFSCKNENCSYLLLDKSEGNQAYLVADLAQLKEIKLSPDNTKVLIHFTRNKEMPLALGNIVVVELTEWELLSIENVTNDKEILDYTWPILSTNWNTDDSLSITIPAIPEPTKEELSEWQKNQSNTETISLELE